MLQDCRDAAAITDKESEILMDALMLSGEQTLADLPWLSLSDEALGGIMHHLLPPNQVHGKAVAAMRVLELKLQALSSPASSQYVHCLIKAGAPAACSSPPTATWEHAEDLLLPHTEPLHSLNSALPRAYIAVLGMPLVVYTEELRSSSLAALSVTGRHHGSLLAQHMLQQVLVAASLNAVQAEVCLKILRSCTQDSQLPRLMLTLTAQQPDWGGLWNERTVAVMQCLMQLRPAIPEVNQSHQADLCPASSSIASTWLDLTV